MKSEQSELIRSAIPEVFEAKARALGGLRAPVMLFRDVVRLTNLTTKQMKPIIENKALNFSMTGDGPRPKVQYDRASTTDFIERLNASARPTTIEGLLGIPRYAVEQLVCLGELRHEDHPAIALLHDGLRIAAFSTYLEGLIDAGSTGLAPSKTLALSRAMRRIADAANHGGRS